jgi:transcriptional regulator with XRE-family HTH domain
LRIAAKLTQEQLAEKAGLSVHNLRNWEHDHRTPGIEGLYLLAKGLGVPMEEFAVTLLTKTTPPRPPARPGRPAKASEGPAAEKAAKKPRGKK